VRTIIVGGPSAPSHCPSPSAPAFQTLAGRDVSQLGDDLFHRGLDHGGVTVTGIDLGNLVGVAITPAVQ
jgi:hypothetical protein